MASVNFQLYTFFEAGLKACKFHQCLHRQTILEIAMTSTILQGMNLLVDTKSSTLGSNPFWQMRRGIDSK
jgi:hypothetical protein